MVAEAASASLPISPDEFSALLDDRFAPVLGGKNIFAAGVSGGPDSMALLRLLSGWAEKNNKNIHAITVDHGLRPEAAQEARQVGEWIKGWSAVRHEILVWEGEKPEKRIQEEARSARYELMGAYCRGQGIDHLFLAHHQDDQAETFLLRLAMGSGLDGLAAMRAIHTYNSGLVLLRPLLGIGKERLVATCSALALPFVNDPSNKSENFARVRLRKSLAALEAEGLSNKRLAVTSERLDRARLALDEITEKANKSTILYIDTNRIVYKYDVLREWPDEIVLRVIISAMKSLRPPRDYLPRMEKIEALFRDFMSPAPFTKRTLGGLIFERDDALKHLIVRVENMDKSPA